ncbi:MAG: AIR synthase family protein [Anaerovoracaceae bacterium]|jgi:hydrogenase expression/formation protein HypE
MKTGKLDSKLLEEIVFKYLKFRRPEVLVRPGIGEDCAVLDYGEYECVLSTDPITGAINKIGHLAVHISCNDIASNGVEPLGLLLAIMLPEGTSEQQIEDIMRQAGETAELMGVEIIGGHTEITASVNKPIIVSTAVGKALKGSSQSAKDMKPGDYILVTKTAGLEGTGIIASDYSERLEGILTQQEMSHALAMLEKVSVVKEGVIAGRIGTSGMHDVTEGGLLGAIWEMCEISGLGAEIWEERVPIDPVTVKVCNYLGLNPLRLISSGCMMIVSDPEKKDEMIKVIANNGIEIACIGRVMEGDYGRLMLKNGMASVITPPVSDELYKVVV